MAEAVQLRGTPVILAAFDRIDISTWALFYKRKCLYKCVGEDVADSKATLHGFLKQLEASNTSATYELGFYDGLKDKKKIRTIEEADYAYNVVLFHDEEYPAPGAVSRQTGYSLIMQEIADVKAQLALRQKEDEEEEEDEPEKVAGVGSRLLTFLDKLLDNPAVEQKIGQIASNFLENLVTPSKPITMHEQPREMGAMGAVPDEVAEPGKTMITQEQALKIQRSIEILAAADPNLGDHLEKIAQVAQSNPKKYKNLILMLNSFI